VTPEPEEEYEEEPAYPTADDMPHPEHHHGPLGMPQPAYDADMLNFLQHTIAGSFYPELVAAIARATQMAVHRDQLEGQHTPLSRGAAVKLKFLADKYINPAEYVVTNIKDNRQFRSILNDYRMDAANAKVGLRRIDYNSTFISFLSAMENHLQFIKDAIDEKLKREELQ